MATDKTRYKDVKVRIPEEELAVLNCRVAKTGMSREQYMQTADRVVGQGQTAAWGGFGAMLLREDAGGYVLVGVAAFTAAFVLTVVCMRLHEREKQKRKHEEDAT